MNQYEATAIFIIILIGLIVHTDLRTRAWKRKREKERDEDFYFIFGRPYDQAHNFNWKPKTSDEIIRHAEWKKKRMELGNDR